jgi:hypothetical protein
MHVDHRLAVDCWLWWKWYAGGDSSSQCSDRGNGGDHSGKYNASERFVGLARTDPLSGRNLGLS